MRMGLAGLRGGEHARNGGVIDKVMTDLSRWRRVAAADAGCAHDADAGACFVLQLMQQLFRAQHGAGKRIANANRQRRNVRLAFLHDVEMRIEGRGLEHFGKRQLHLVGEGRKVRCGNLVISVLDQMQMFDQEIALPRALPQQQLNLMRRGRVDLAALRRRLGPLAPRAGVLEGANFLRVMNHRAIDPIWI